MSFLGFDIAVRDFCQVFDPLTTMMMMMMMMMVMMMTSRDIHGFTAFRV